ncbi:MAG TPA: SRPBCC family protein [Streptosporangiaceae bacterium]|nr:SRPBCC family protein [Streptosporangiaceae bacterium]
MVAELDVTGVRIAVEVTVAAEPGLVWDLLADVGRVGEWSPECDRASWLGLGGAPRAGARFSGHNRLGAWEWTVTCVVTEAERPRVFAWVVLYGEEGAGHDPGEWTERASSFWRYDLDPGAAGGTVVRESFTHGPGGSGLRTAVARAPDKADLIVSRRREQLRSNMLETLAGMKAAAESGLH